MRTPGTAPANKYKCTLPIGSRKKGLHVRPGFGLAVDAFSTAPSDGGNGGSGDAVLAELPVNLELSVSTCATVARKDIPSTALKPKERSS